MIAIATQASMSLLPITTTVAGEPDSTRKLTSAARAPSTLPFSQRCRYSSAGSETGSGLAGESVHWQQQTSNPNLPNHDGLETRRVQLVPVQLRASERAMGENTTTWMENTTEPVLWASPNGRNYNWLLRCPSKFGHCLQKSHGTALRFQHQTQVKVVVIRPSSLRPSTNDALAWFFRCAFGHVGKEDMQAILNMLISVCMLSVMSVRTACSQYLTCLIRFVRSRSCRPEMHVGNQR